MTEPLRDHPDTLVSPGQDEFVAVKTAERTCLTEEELLAFAQGRLDSDRLRAVHAHADGCEACQHLMTEAIHAVAAESTPESDAGQWNATFVPNTMVAGRYRIHNFIARGGMGEVYDAFDCAIGERIALKAVISTACDSPRAVQYLKREVQMARHVSHPNVCRIFDFDTHVLEGTGATIHFLTMEFVDGEPLGQRLRRDGPLSLAQATNFARELLCGLSAAHDAGILHRDFKSDNVMLRKSTGGEFRPVILDFGLARYFEQNARTLTSGRHQGLAGTPSYMAPEQIEGKKLSPASDLYAFGVVWFEMLTGKLPFKADTATANALERLRKPPTVPSSENPQVPKTVDAIVLKCLSRRVEDRYQSAAQVLDALNALATQPRRPRISASHAWTLVGGGVTSALALAVLAARQGTPRVDQVSSTRSPPTVAALAASAMPQARCVVEPDPVAAESSQPEPSASPRLLTANGVERPSGDGRAPPPLQSRKGIARQRAGKPRAAPTPTADESRTEPDTPSATLPIPIPNANGNGAGGLPDPRSGSEASSKAAAGGKPGGDVPGALQSAESDSRAAPAGSAPPPSRQVQPRRWENPWEKPGVGPTSTTSP